MMFTDKDTGREISIEEIQNKIDELFESRDFWMEKSQKLTLELATKSKDFDYLGSEFRRIYHLLNRERKISKSRMDRLQIALKKLKTCKRGETTT